MVYFPETATPVTADVKTVAGWTARIDSEYREMPGLRVTLAQAAGLWGSPAPHYLALPGPLVARGRLVETPDGLYCVAGGLRRARGAAAGRPCAS